MREQVNEIRALGLVPSVLEADGVALTKSNDVVRDSMRGSTEVNSMKKNELSRQGAIATMALASFLRPRLAQDAKLNLLPVFNGITFKNYTERKGDVLRRIEKACKGKIAIDTSLGEVAEFLDMLDGGGNPMEDDDEMPAEMEKPIKEVGEKFAEPDQMDADPLSAVMAFLKDKLRPEDLQQVME